MDANSGAKEQGITRVPQITERDLHLDYKSLRHLGWERFNTEQLLKHLNAVFFDKTMAQQMLDQYRENINYLNQKPNPGHTEALKISTLEILGKYLDYASRGNSESALLMLQSVSTGVNQHKVVETQSNILNIDGQPFFNTPPKMNAANAFFALSRIMYASAHEGRLYESDAAQQRLEQQKAQMRNIKIR